MNSDSEKGPPAKNTYGGYERLGKFMGDVPEVAIVRRFRHLSAQNILHLQAEICQLEEDLAKFQKEDKATEERSLRHTYDSHSGVLRDSINHDRLDEHENQNGGVGNASNGNANHGDKYDSRQWRTMLRIRGALEEYYEAVIRHSKIANLKSPDERQLTDLKDWMERETRGNILLIGPDSDVWNETKIDELVSMAPIPNEDSMPSPSTIKLVNLYHKIIGRHIHKEPKDEDHFQNTVLYDERIIESVTRVIKALVACLLPIVGIVVLYVVKTMALRLGLIAIFTAAFALVLCFFTPANVKDIFSATAAFSAVLVVFIGAT